MNGLEFIKQVRTKDQDINIVLITGHLSQESIKESLNLRIINYLPKPFSPELLLEVVNKGVALKKEGRCSQKQG